MMYLVDQSKPCARIYLQKNACCINLQLSIVVFLNRLFKTCIVIKRTCISIFSKIRFVDQSEPCTQNNLQKNRKLHTFATIPIVIFKKSIISDMRHRKTFMYIYMYIYVHV